MTGPGDRAMTYSGTRRTHANRLPFDRPEPVPEGRALKGTRSALIFVAVYLFLGVLTPLQLFSGESGEATIPFIICMLIQHFAALRIAALACGKARFITITFYFFVYIWIGWAGSIQLYLDALPWPQVHTDEQLFWSMSVIVLALMSYELGQAFAGRHDRVRGVFPLRAPPFRLSLNRLLAIWLFSFVGFAYGLIYFGIDGVLGTRASALRGVEAGTSSMSIDIARALMRAPCFVSFIAAGYLAKNHWRELTRNNKSLLLLILSTSAVVTFIANYPPAVPRSWLGAIVITPMIVFTPWSRRTALWWVLILAIVLMWAYPRADLFRRAGSWTTALNQLTSQEEVKEHVFTVDYDVLQMTTNAYVYVEHQGISWGNNVAAALFFFVPRKIWTAKAQRSDLLISHDIGYTQNNLSVPFWSEMYLAFGWVGLPLVLYLYGFWSRRMDNSYIRLRESNNLRYMTPAALLVPFWAAYQFYFLRGNLITAIGFAFLAVVLFTVVFKVVKPRPHAAGPASARA